MFDFAMFDFYDWFAVGIAVVGTLFVLTPTSVWKRKKPKHREKRIEREARM